MEWSSKNTTLPPWYNFLEHANSAPKNKEYMLFGTTLSLDKLEL